MCEKGLGQPDRLVLSQSYWFWGPSINPPTIQWLLALFSLSPYRNWGWGHEAGARCSKDGKSLSDSRAWTLSHYWVRGYPLQIHGTSGETTKMSKMGNEKVVRTDNVHVSLKGEDNSATGHNVGGPWGHSTKWKKSATERQTVCDFSYKKYPK